MPRLKILNVFDSIIVFLGKAKLFFEPELALLVGLQVMSSKKGGRTF